MQQYLLMIEYHLIYLMSRMINLSDILINSFDNNRYNNKKILWISKNPSFSNDT